MTVECLDNGKFQSTSPVWRTTNRHEREYACREYFNPRPPCGGRLLKGIKRGKVECISIHVPRVEDDQSSRYHKCLLLRFQSTSPVWRTTVYDGTFFDCSFDFNPRPPCGGRRLSILLHLSVCHFNPRPPCGGRHITTPGNLAKIIISIHVPRVEDDALSTGGLSLKTTKFQSTSPVWRTTD